MLHIADCRDILYAMAFVAFTTFATSLAVATEIDPFDPKITASDALEFAKAPLESIELKCPAENGGIMQYLKKNSEGIVIKSRYKFSSAKAGKLIIEISKRGRGFETIYAVDIDKPDPGSRLGIILRDVYDANKLYNQICSDPNALRRFKVQADENRRKLTAEESSEKLAPKSERNSSKNKPLMTIDIKCAATNGGVLELIRMNTEGATGRLRFKVADNQIVSYIIEGAEPGSWFKEVERANLRLEYTKEFRAEMLKTISEFQPFHDEVCSNPGHFARFKALTRSNRNMIPKTLLGKDQ